MLISRCLGVAGVQGDSLQRNEEGERKGNERRQEREEGDERAREADAQREGETQGRQQRLTVEDSGSNGGPCGVFERRGTGHI